MKDKEIHGSNWDIDPLVIAPEHHGKRTQRVKYVKPVTFYACPHCTNIKVGIILDGTHLVWRPHYRTTYSGVKMLCIASGAPLCANPPFNVLAIVHCPHR